ncbi:DEKNAAC100391 [Brettanomyces naardenensis]|uniref:DEKNAAC100391 n=1 Tax=Brettanomyces naardenensis TaxID=13370 RepID=A0A448YEZ4_BRENA|nr:DEKNAAC100391 [Brettanomyces naardenensis]
MMSESKEGKDAVLEKALSELQSIEKDQQELDKKVQKYRVELTKPLFEKRRKIILEIPKFWYIVLAQHEDFQEYIQTEDMKYLEFIKDIYVEKSVDEKGENEDPKSFALTITFESPDAEIEDQTVTKYFYSEVDPDTGYESIKSYKADVKWPQEFDNINPNLIKENRKNDKWTHEEKKNYRIGMKSFFAFFGWTGSKEGKEYRYGEQLAEMLSEDIFPLAVDYYTLAAPGLGKNEEEEDADSSSEELDIDSDDDGQDESDQTNDNHSSKRQKKE